MAAIRTSLVSHAVRVRVSREKIRLLFLIFLFRGTIFGCRRRFGDEATELERVPGRVVDVLEPVAAQQNVAEPTGHDDGHILHIQNLQEFGENRHVLQVTKFMTHPCYLKILLD